MLAEVRSRCPALRQTLVLDDDWPRLMAEAARDLAGGVARAPIEIGAGGAGPIVLRIVPDDAAALERLQREGPSARLCQLLTPPEIEALLHRAAWLVHLRALPELVDDGGWPPYPWPLV